MGRIPQKVNAPTQLTVLRQKAILLASARCSSRCFLLLLGNYKCGCVPASLGGSQGVFVCAELVTTLCPLIDKRCGCGMRTCCWVHYDSVRRAAILAAMRRRGVPHPLALANIPGARRADMAFSHTSQETDPIKAGIGLLQGCLASPDVISLGPPVLPGLIAQILEWPGGPPNGNKLGQPCEGRRHRCVCWGKRHGKSTTCCMRPGEKHVAPRGFGTTWGAEVGANRVTT